MFFFIVIFCLYAGGFNSKIDDEVNVLLYLFKHVFYIYIYIYIYRVHLWSSLAGAARSLLICSRAAPMATAGGMLSMLGVQAARAVTSMIQRMHIVDL